MKIHFSILFLFISATLCFGQAKELTLNDAVMQQYRTYGPDRITSFQWLPNSSSYSFLSKNMQTLYKSNVTEVSSAISPDAWMTIAEVNKILSTELTYFSGLQWIDESHCYLNDGQKYYYLDLKLKTGKELLRLDDGAENMDFHAGSQQMAYTQGNNLYIKKGTNEAVAITSNADKNIV